MIFDKLFFISPMDLGDYFVQSGIINYYADRTSVLHLPVKHHNYDTLFTLFQDHPNIRVVPITYEEQHEYIKTHGLSRITNDWKLVIKEVYGHPAALLWDEQIYTHFELPFSMRYSNFRLPRYINGSDELYEKLYKDRPYILIHRRTGHHPDGISINIEGFRKTVGLPDDIDIIEITPDITSNMMHYIKLIEHAAEIHCVNSSFFCLVDSVFKLVKGSLYFHDIRGSSVIRINSEWNNYCWNVVNYIDRV